MGRRGGGAMHTYVHARKHGNVRIPYRVRQARVQSTSCPYFMPTSSLASHLAAHGGRRGRACHELKFAWVAGCGASVLRRVLELSLSVGVWGGVPKLGRDLVPWAPIYFRVYAEVYLAPRQQTQGVETDTDVDADTSCVGRRKIHQETTEREREQVQDTHERRYASADTSPRVRGFPGRQQERNGEPISVCGVVKLFVVKLFIHTVST
jgi:hypothetical protein